MFKTAFLILFFLLLSACKPTPFPAQPGNNGPTSSGGPYSQEALNYFYEVGFGSELGRSDNTIAKWTNSINIYIGGGRPEDRSEIQEIIEELKTLTGLSINIVDDHNQSNLKIIYTSTNSFTAHCGSYKPSTHGVQQGLFCNEWKEPGNVIVQGKVLIDNSLSSQVIRSHLVREELTQCLGLMQDSYAYPDSIFQQTSTSVTEFSELDKEVIRILYDHRLQPGMTKAEVIRVLEGDKRQIAARFSI